MKNLCKVENFTIIIPIQNKNGELSTFSTEFSTSESKRALQQKVVKLFYFTAYIHLYIYILFIYNIKIMQDYIQFWFLFDFFPFYKYTFDFRKII